MFHQGMARSIYVGGGVFPLLLLLSLTFHTVSVLPERDHRENLSPQAAMNNIVFFFC